MSAQFDALGKLQRTLFPRRNLFEPWYHLFKLCFPYPDTALGFALGVDACSFLDWKHGRRRPSKTVIRFIAVLVMLRVGKLRTHRDLVQAGILIASGKLPQMVADFLAQEQIDLAKLAAKRKVAKEKRAAKRAQSVTQRDIPPGETPKSA